MVSSTVLKATSGTAVTRATTQASSPKGALTARFVPVSVLPVTPDVLIYGTAGGALQSVKLTDTDTGNSDRNTMLGWTAGAGADVKVTEQVFGRVEYRYTDFGARTTQSTGKPPEADSHGHRLMLGVGMKF